MLIKYLGGRSRFKISYNRKSYHFTPENNHILDIQEKEVINYIFGLPNRAEFEAVMEETKPKIPEIKKEEITIKPEKKKGEKKNARKKRK